MVNVEELSNEELVAQYQDAVKNNHKSLVNSIGSSLYHRLAGIMKSLAKKHYKAFFCDELDDVLAVSFWEAMQSYDASHQATVLTFLYSELNAAMTNFFRKHNKFHDHEMLTDPTDPESQAELDAMLYQSDPMKLHQTTPLFSLEPDKPMMIEYCLHLVSLLPPELEEVFIVHSLSLPILAHKKKNSSFYRLVERAYSLLRSLLKQAPTSNLHLQMLNY